jgi:hypothetical protein
LKSELNITKSFPTNKYRSGLRKRNAPLSIDGTLETLRHTPPEVDRKSISGTDYVVRAHRKIHGNRASVASARREDVQSKTLWSAIVRCNLNIKIH